MSDKILTQARLKELLHYCPDSGLFTWMASRGSIKKGCVSGTAHSEGYINIGVDGSRYFAHRLAFLYMVGVMPKEDVDHINHSRDDNRWGNLRGATRADNSKNSSISKSSTSGISGVSWHKASAKWRAHIRVDGKQKHLGSYGSLTTAGLARKKAERKYGFHENHGVTDEYSKQRTTQEDHCRPRS
jgi:hypothetical protein